MHVYINVHAYINTCVDINMDVYKYIYMHVKRVCDTEAAACLCASFLHAGGCLRLCFAFVKPGKENISCLVSLIKYRIRPRLGGPDGFPAGSDPGALSPTR